jgi:hypothetical protein
MTMTRFLDYRLVTRTSFRTVFLLALFALGSLSVRADEPAKDIFAVPNGSSEELLKCIKNYEAYHSRGFEIIGLSMDHRLEPLQKFVKEKEIPWGIVYGNTKPSPSFEYYNFSAIPKMILVGKDGKVVSTNARGKELDSLLEKLLEKLLGPVTEK